MTTSKSEYWISESNKEDKFEDHYLMGTKLGVGSTCSVFSCVERTTGRQWAVKVLRKKENRKFALAEIAVLFTLNHPNVAVKTAKERLIRLKEVFENLSFIYIILEMVTGGELFERIVAKGNYSERDAAECTIQMLQGIKYLHDNDVVHRDIKPENLLYSDPSEHAVLKIADFGLAKIVPKESLLKTLCGTPGYCAPELLKRSSYSREVDMWAVGVIVYILLCGYEPFYHNQEAKVFRRILRCDYKFHPAWWINISENAKDLISHLLVLNPNKRLTAAQALSHPWVKGFATRHANLVEAQHEMRRLNARRRLRAASYAVVAFRTTPLSVMTVESKRLLIGGEENVAEQPKPSTSKSNTKAK